MSNKSGSWNSSSFHSVESINSHNSKDSGSWKQNIKPENQNENMDPSLKETNEF